MSQTSDREQLRYFEDFEVGMTSEFGPRAITEAEIIDFAAQWDPQPFHLDGEAARASMYGGLIASGWHTAVVTMSMLATKRPLTAGAGSPGLDELRWLAPVRAGATLRGSSAVFETRASQSRPAIGIVRSRVETVDDSGAAVLRYLSTFFVRRRYSSGDVPPHLLAAGKE
jgi:acyl dehydratase